MPTGSFMQQLTTDQTVANPAANTPGGKDPKDIIGAAVPRIDGPLKTTGTAKYTSDYNLPGMVYAVPVCASIAKGRITRLDASKAEGMRGVLKVYHRANAPTIYRPNPADCNAHLDEARPRFEDDVIYYAWQDVAVVVAGTMDQA